MPYLDKRDKNVNEKYLSSVLGQLTVHVLVKFLNQDRDALVKAHFGTKHSNLKSPATIIVCNLPVCSTIIIP